jgi:hypothetical protein
MVGLVCCLAGDAGAPQCVASTPSCAQSDPSQPECQPSTCNSAYLECDGPEDCALPGQWCCLEEPTLNYHEHTLCLPLDMCGAWEGTPVCEVLTDCEYLGFSSCQSATIYNGGTGVGGSVDICQE